MKRDKAEYVTHSRKKLSSFLDHGLHEPNSTLTSIIHTGRFYILAITNGNVKSAPRLDEAIQYVAKKFYIKTYL